MELFLEMLARQVREQPLKPALACEGEELSYGKLGQLVDRIAAGLRTLGVRPGDSVALLSELRPVAVAVFLGALRAGAVAVPLPTWVPVDALAATIGDSDAKVLMFSQALRQRIAELGSSCAGLVDDGLICTDCREPGANALDDLVAGSTALLPVEIDERDPFDVIYSSGTTGIPKGIVHPHRMRSFQVERMSQLGIAGDTTVLLATPLYSNTTLVALLPTLARGGTAVLLPAFNRVDFLETAQRRQATHTMLVPVQYRRLLDDPTFSHFDLSAFRGLFCTGAPLSAALKHELLDRWPARLIELYGLTEGGCTTVLDVGAHPDKFDTVGCPATGVEIVVLDEQGQELPAGQIGEIAGRAPSMMSGYRGRPDLTDAVTWRDAQGRRFIRTGDLGSIDDDGFLRLHGRTKDVIISGGFNIYPEDLERAILGHPAVTEVAVVAAPSDRWGETPVAFIVLRRCTSATTNDVAAFANSRLGPVQQVSQMVVIDALPRNSLGKVRRDELRATAKLRLPAGH